MSSITKLRIATRKSQLAMWQAEYVRDRLMAAHSGLDVELVPPLHQRRQNPRYAPFQIGGKGLFVKELEDAMLDGRADIAVHSMKDVPMPLPRRLGAIGDFRGGRPHRCVRVQPL